MVHLATALTASPSLHGATIRARPAARTTRLARPSRRTAVAPLAAVDPASATLWAYQAQEFGLTIMGAGIVSGLASVTARAVRQAAATVTPAPLSAEEPLPQVQAARVAAAPAAAAPATPAAEQPPALVAVQSLELADIKSELQQAADAAVAAVKTALAAEPAAKPAAAKAAPAAAAAPAPNGAAAKPGMTVEEATQQVKDWIAAWRGEGSAEPAPPAADASPATAAAVLDALTADAPVAATPVGGDAPAPPAAPAANEPVPSAVAAGAAPSVDAPAGEDEAAAEEREREYKARIAAVVADSKLAAPAGSAAAEESARAERVADRMQKRVVQVGPEYQAKIESLWQGYESKKAEEAALLQKSQQILEGLAEREAAERQQLVEAAAAAAAAPAPAAAPTQSQQERGALAVLFARITSFFQALQRWVQQLVAGLTGGSGSGSSAGASA